MENKRKKAMTTETEIVVEIETEIENTENAEITETAIAPGEPITTEEQKAIEEVLKPSENKTYVITLDQELRDLLDMIYSKESECRQRERVVESCKEQLKYAKELFDEATLELRSLIRQSHEKRIGSQNDENRPLFNNPPGAGNTESVEPTTDWRSLSTEILLDPPIEGFGAKKRQALLDALPTLGAFEDLRSRVGRDAATLRELLPKGIGEQAADALEERLITAIQKHGITDEPVTEAVADSPANDDDSDDELINFLALEGLKIVLNAENPADPAERIQQWAIALYGLANSSSEVFLESIREHDPEIVAEGAEAYNVDMQVDECPYKIDSKKFSGWMHGWISKYVEDPDQTGDESAEAEQSSDLATEPTTPISAIKLTPQELDDL